MKIAIAGYGIEGKASYDYWNKDGNELTIVDQGTPADVPSGVRVLSGDDVFSQLQDFDMVIRTASLNPRHIVTNGKVWSATNEFFEKCPAPIIGVTGTKGKGTTSSLIASILRAAGKTVHLVGNIGTPALDVLPKITSSDVVVYELSSFQLWDAKKSPHVAVVLMIEPDHLDVHADFEDYLKAKMNITINQLRGDFVVYNENNEWSMKIGKVSPADTTTSYPFGIDEFKDSIKIPGLHNQENASAAIAAVRPWVRDRAAIANGLAAFTGLPHRLKFVRKIHDVSYYDDSIATTPGSAIAAIKAFSQPKVLILGGSDKGSSYNEIIDTCRATGTKVIAIGQTGEVIAALCQQKSVECIRESKGMTSVVATAYQMSKAGNVVILSPASASFDQYKNYADRGDQFIAAVENL